MARVKAKGRARVKREEERSGKKKEVVEPRACRPTSADEIQL